MGKHDGEFYAQNYHKYSTLMDSQTQLWIHIETLKNCHENTQSTENKEKTFFNLINLNYILIKIRDQLRNKKLVYNKRQPQLKASGL